MKKVLIFGLTVIDEGILDTESGICTTAKIYNTIYPGGTNQVVLKKLFDEHGNIYHIIGEFK
jgi:hypothetical protein